jgi:hypothetical protein
MNKKLHIAFLYMIYPGVVFAWFFILFPFLIWDSLSEDWYPEFKRDMLSYATAVKQKREEYKND